MSRPRWPCCSRRCLRSSFGMMVRQREEVRFAADSPVEGAGFEPSVPLAASRTGAGSKNVVPLTGDRGFESPSLQRRVTCELNGPSHAGDPRSESP
jgi:hypothetical protein